MRTFNFKVRNIGDEKYLTYVMGEECELDEDVLDYCEDNDVKELIGIIYEEDDDYDYLTYDISDKVSLDEYIKDYVNCEDVLAIIRNIANGLISLKEQTIQLSYILLNRSFIYVDEENLSIKFICLPVESDSSIITEFKGFIRQLLANMKYDVDEDLNYVGKLITYVNGDKFTLRDLIGLCEALMEEAGIDYNDVSTIDADGIEVVNASHEDTVSGFMDSLGGSDEPLPEIGDDDEEEPEEDEEVGAPIVDLDKVEDETSEDEELENQEEEKAEEVEDTEAVEETVEEPETPVEEPEVAEEAETEEAVAEAETEEPSEEPKEVEEKADEHVKKKARLSIVQDNDDVLGINEYDGMANSGILVNAGPKMRKETKETDVDAIKNRIKELVGDAPVAKSNGENDKNIKTLDEVESYLGRRPAPKKNVVKVNRAAIIQNVEAEIEKDVEQNAVETTSDDNPTENIAVPVVEEVNAPEPAAPPVPAANAVVNSVANVPKAAPYLVRVNTEERVMILKVPFKIGKATRGVDYTIRGNGAVSRQHAIIIEKEGVCYIKDNKSTNHTYVNGKVVEDGAEEMLTHDSMITLGDEDFIFKIR